VASGTGGYAAAGLTVVGVFCGSALWWLVLSSGVSLLRSRFDTRMLRGVNVVSGIILLGFSAVALLSIVSLSAVR
jgi:arginine exporter protein ArgO